MVSFYRKMPLRNEDDEAFVDNEKMAWPHVLHRLCAFAMGEVGVHFVAFWSLSCDVCVSVIDLVHDL